MKLLKKKELIIKIINMSGNELDATEKLILCQFVLSEGFPSNISITAYSLESLIGIQMCAIYRKINRLEKKGFIKKGKSKERSKRNLNCYSFVNLSMEL